MIKLHKILLIGCLLLCSCSKDDRLEICHQFCALNKDAQFDKLFHVKVTRYYSYYDYETGKNAMLPSSIQLFNDKWEKPMWMFVYNPYQKNDELAIRFSQNLYYKNKNNNFLQNIKRTETITDTMSLKKRYELFVDSMFSELFKLKLPKQINISIPMFDGRNQYIAFYLFGVDEQSMENLVCYYSEDTNAPMSSHDLEQINEHWYIGKE